jgi:transcriptional regulator with XRE-family HTH domain
MVLKRRITLEDNTRYLFRIGTALAAVRKQAGMTQDKLAHQSKMNRSHMSNIEQNKDRPSWDTIVKLAIGLGMPIDELVKALSDEDKFKKIFDELPEK